MFQQTPTEFDKYAASVWRDIVQDCINEAMQYQGVQRVRVYLRAYRGGWNGGAAAMGKRLEVSAATVRKALAAEGWRHDGGGLWMPPASYYSTPNEDKDGLLEGAETIEPTPAPDEGGKRGRDYTTTPLSPSDVREVISTPPPPPALPAGINPADIPAQAFPYSIYTKSAAIGGRDVSLIYARLEGRKVKRAIRAGVLAPHMALNAFAHEGV